MRSAQVAEHTPAVPIPSRAELAARVDWRDWYLTDEADMGESPEQTAIIALLVGALRTWIDERGWTSAFAGGDNFFAWIEGEPLVRVSPDVYLLFDPPAPLPASWQTWRDAHPVPPFAMEIVSSEWRKDYEGAPQKYAQLGVDELIVFDPGASDGPGGERTRFQAWRRRDGLFVRTDAGAGPVWSDALGLWLHAREARPAYRFVCRLARDEAGLDLVLDGHERAHAEAQRAEVEAQRAAAEAQRADDAVARIAALEARLRALDDAE